MKYMMFLRFYSFTLIGFFASGFPAVAQNDYILEGELFTTFRSYLDDGLYFGQSKAGGATMFGGRLRYSQEFDIGNLFLEISGQSNQKTNDEYLDIPRGYFQFVGDGFDVLAGSNIEYWGVSESHQVVDVINQKYDLDYPVNPKNLGQPMLNVNISTGTNSTLSFFGLLGFREKDLGDRSNRFRTPFGTSEKRVFFEESNGRDFDFALRYRTSQRVGNGSVDLALSYFDGTNREPKMLPGCIRDTGIIGPILCNSFNQIARLRYERNPRVFDESALSIDSDGDAALVSNLRNFGLIPYYQHLRQVGLELVYSMNDVQLTFEGAWRQAMNEHYFSGIAGVQYTFNEIGQNGGSLVAVGEYLYDDRSSAHPLTVFDNDLFLGFRYGANDIAGTSLTGGVYVDLDSHSQIYSIKYSRRLNDSMRLNISSFAINADDYSDPLAFAGSDSFVEISLSYYF